jgi:hypothetical protein
MSRIIQGKTNAAFFNTIIFNIFFLYFSNARGVWAFIGERDYNWLNTVSWKRPKAKPIVRAAQNSFFKIKNLTTFSSRFCLTMKLFEDIVNAVGVFGTKIRKPLQRLYHRQAFMQLL